jgi:hypothetical protein
MPLKAILVTLSSTTIPAICRNVQFTRACQKRKRVGSKATSVTATIVAAAAAASVAAAAAALTMVTASATIATTNAAYKKRE